MGTGARSLLMSPDSHQFVIAGRVVTMDPARPAAEAVVVKGDRIAFVGALDEARSLAPSAEVIDSGGGSVLPGFHDAHIHPWHGGLARLECGLHDASSLDEYSHLIRTYADDHPDRPWILGSGWAMSAFPGGNPRREDLDAVVSDRPVALTSRDVHSLWVNSRALEAAGVDASTADPPNGVIVRDEGGNPTGTLHEDAMDLVQVVAPAPSPEESREALMLAQQEMHSLGIVSWQDAWVHRSLLDCYLSAARERLFTGHVVLSLHWNRERDSSQLVDLIEMREAAERDGLSASTVKIFLDGIVESATALLLEPYLDAEGRRTESAGFELVPRDQLLSYAALLDRSGFQLHFHAIGDGAVRLGLDAIEAARAATGPRDARHHIAHIQVINPADIPRFAELDAIPNAQPYWAYMDDQMRHLNIPLLGPERTRQQYPFATLLRAGARLAMGSDWPVSTPNPLLEMEVAVRRSDPESADTDAFLPDEILSIDQALTGFTTNSAFVNRLDNSGRLSEGLRADVVVLDRDIYSIEGSRLSNANVSLTVANGRIVHQA
jgi:predicted amidohydrolase YtcJ